MSLQTLYQYYTDGGIASGLTANNTYFKLNDKNITLYGGAMHYFRVPQKDWRIRLRQMRAAGLNAVETYVPWNLHEPSPDVYDFGAGGSDFQELLDIEKFLKIAKEEDLFAIVRPGPYIFSEWEFGGLPSWLLRVKDIQVGRSDQALMGFVEKYLKVLLPILTMLQFSLGGPIIAFKIENEYGSLQMNGSECLNGIIDIFTNSNVSALLITSDEPSLGNSGQIPGVLYTSTFDPELEYALDMVQRYQPGKPSMVMEFPVANRYYSNNLERILKYPASIHIDMFHGGTNFGFMNGAYMLSYSTNNQPYTNEDNYEALLSENGDYTDKYYATKDVIAKHNTEVTKLPAQPIISALVAYDAIRMSEFISFEDIIIQSPHKIHNKLLMSMELLPINNNAGQNYGYIVYRKINLDITKNSSLKIEGRVCDTVMVLINGILVSKVLESNEDLDGFGYWRIKDSILNLGDVAYTNATLELVVENIKQFAQFKGLWQGNVSINNANLYNWEIIPLEFKRDWISNINMWQNIPNKSIIGPALYRVVLMIHEEPADTYIDMRKWNKGIVIVNSFVLSRYSKIEPHQTAYLPAALLKKGSNEFYIFEQFVSDKYLTFSDKPIFYNLYDELDSEF